MATGTGTREDPWQLTTAPGTSDYQMWRDEAADPPTLVCQVGTTQLKYHLSAIDDLHAMLKAHGDWMDLGAADEQKDAKPDTVEAWGRMDANGRWLVWAAQGLSRPVRDVPAAAARGPRAGRADPRREEQQGPRDLILVLEPVGVRRSLARRGPVRAGPRRPVLASPPCCGCAGRGRWSRRRPRPSIR